MNPFVIHSGVVAPLDRVNVDTDAIIPKQFLKRIERSGFGQFLFYEWRFTVDGAPIDTFILNTPAYKESTVLLARNNFGCGSSREHAPWALLDYGFRCVIAPSFADIFYNNCFKNGILPIKLSEEQVDELFNRAQNKPNYQLTIDLQEQVVRDSEGLSYPFEVDSYRRYCLLNGLDDIGITLQYEDKITAYEASR
ncbi:3-isopropylmalate dehydratase small subunit [Brevibacillus porteri]|uniref:3-isopropylmalate dehydratase small subunit n=1 Tax=Brevibacillus porteri TaxID=2126350 RepID=A0ABX5FJ37_9BACL|nr:3-isopropylmalate dehydratase small subunit [Brevibacillus porteri]MED1800068.1 3-isopropylmalate dehydratase small subunit [Brevibacillus porteri]MED2134478.1 3-isopropylmalate dehydratase small subunit [Brevibacillus porteri]MED2747197.1 3-isopropylmalate dehydratase small subunit [Brevibacillus porteri]MED2812439.1 3-isopropylmalate dehydratase small subunit [Brevibacillus porteri]MED2897020.1 3-isopropylmalate dehydratase small subunit [Brevibacillus porteri]